MAGVMEVEAVRPLTGAGGTRHPAGTRFPAEEAQEWANYRRLMEAGRIRIVPAARRGPGRPRKTEESDHGES